MVKDKLILSRPFRGGAMGYILSFAIRKTVRDWVRCLRESEKVFEDKALPSSTRLVTGFSDAVLCSYIQNGA